MLHRNMPVTFPQFPSDLYILGGTDLQNLGPDHPGQVGPVGHRNTCNDACSAAADRNRNQNKKNQMGNTHAEVYHKSHSCVDTATKHCGHTAKDQRDD